jgi:hypothetical protein
LTHRLDSFLPAAGRQEFIRLGQFSRDNFFYQSTFLTDGFDNLFASGRLAFDKIFSADSFFFSDMATMSFTFREILCP